MRFMFVFFLLLVLAVLAYASWHVWCIVPLGKVWKGLIVAVMLLCFFSFFFFFRGKLDNLSLNTASMFYDISTSAEIAMLYLVLIFLTADIAKLIHLLPARFLHDSWAGTAAVAALLVGILVYGNIHYRNKVRVPLSLTTSKPLPHDYKIVMASDLHLGYHNRRAELARWVDMINAEKPDLILIAGDIIDISIRPLEEEGMAEEFKRLAAPVYACLGNHEYYSSEPKARQFYSEAGIRLLSDSTAVVDSALTIIGRDDRTNPNRKEVAELARLASDSTYTILLDHQPYNLENTEQCGINFQLSGHTHRGQVWPISWVTDAVYECSWGEWQRSGTRYYVSSGLGIWGGKFRIGTQSEYVVATLSRK